ncbi:MAG: cytochrome-c oxidase, cbb3-type subunit III [Gammaproteobacteria bacterium]|nr:cytochrome-c oxidase, cbb3-type subunit III [Gammaproteobacteria bacterium]NND36274.1 cytochrome-c oxidase, cbb3-type subunit III [Gammaproteobacteria bacterium]
MTAFWSLFIIIITAVSIVVYMLIVNVYSQREVGEKEDHVWDEDLREYNNPLPRWWLGMFWISAIFLVVYLIIYPGMGGFEGTQGWTQQNQYEAEMAAAEKRYGDIYAAFGDVPIDELAKDPEAVKLGQNLFQNYCAQCHGSDGRGAKGFPNLTDASWLYGGSASSIQTTIVNGRMGVMPAQAAVLGDDLDDVVGYVMALSGREAPAGADLQVGKQRFEQVCFACHQMNGKGNPALGAPDLTADLWVHGGTEADIRDVLVNGRINQMPAQGDLLTEDRIRMLVAYVMSMGS